MILVVEGGVRALGFVDFPLFAVDRDIAYIPKSNQAGKFLNENAWVYNDRSMGVATPWNPAGRFNLLLIGNSIVAGGNPFNQPDKLGPMLQRQLGTEYTVWPIATGGWTNVNEMAYLARNPDVGAAAQFFVWEFMAGGLSNATPWAGPYIWPLERPLWAGWYVFRRYAVDRLLSGIEAELPVTGAPTKADTEKFAAAVARLSLATGRPVPGILLLYPTEDNLAMAAHGEEWLSERPMLEMLAQAHHLMIVDVAKDACWRSDLYRPDHVHPTVAGNEVLVGILTRAIKAALSAEPAQLGAVAAGVLAHDQAGCRQGLNAAL